MSHQERIQALELDLAQAKEASRPVIVEEVSRDKDQVTSENRTSGTKRVDLLGGREPEKYYDRPVYREPERLVDRPWEKSLGKVIKENEEERVAKLVSGTIRQDLK